MPELGGVVGLAVLVVSYPEVDGVAMVLVSVFTMVVSALVGAAPVSSWLRLWHAANVAAALGAAVSRVRRPARCA